MEGPTPVSALIHAATMVTAGVFLVVRSSMLFEVASNVLVFVAFIGGLTCFFSAIIGAFQYDIKRIVAYSTCSQLGYMFLSVGLSNYNLGLFHLFNHGFFKALLFLSMGSIIHAISDEQDFRRMGGLIKILPFTYVCILIGSFALMAFPFLTGYYSKDLILEFAYGKFIITAEFFFFLGLGAAFFTAFYSMRLLYWVFFSTTNKNVQYTLTMHESTKGMFSSMLVLSLFSIFFGYIVSDAFSGFGSNFFGNSIYVNFANLDIFEVEFFIR
jgi:NADH-ubiquinone oxidoreductase chain 5